MAWVIGKGRWKEIFNNFVFRIANNSKQIVKNLNKRSIVFNSRSKLVDTKGTSSAHNVESFLENGATKGLTLFFFLDF